VNRKYRIAIFPDESGFVHNKWWHRHLEQRFDNALDALALAEEIVNAKRQHRPCPCGEGCEEKTRLGGTGTIFEEDKREKIHLD